jgi:hypothetical protein
MTAQLLERPKSQTKLSIMRRQHKELLEHLAPGEKTRVICCAAKLINYFERWQEWKKSLYPTQWIYQPLTAIRHDLLDEHTIHVIRQALTLLETLGFLSKRENDRVSNYRNGQDRTHQYLLHSDRVKLALSRVFSESEAETLVNSPFVNSEIPSVNVEIPCVTVETYTQIPSNIPATDSYSLKETREELELSTKEEGDFWQEELSEHLGKNEVDKQLAQENENLGEDNYSAAAAPQIEPKYSMLPNEVEHVKPKLKSDSLSGFYSQDERDDFYQVLLKLGKHKSGVRSVVGWANAIIKSINASEPCEYLNEYRRGELVGSCEKHEWEIAPGKPYPQLVTYLKRRLKSNLMSDDQAIATAYQELSDVNRATAHWESFKRTIANTKADWDKQQALGVSSAYIPPELLPEREVPVEEAVSAMHELQANCIHPVLAPDATDLSSEPMSLPLEPTEDKTLPAAELEPEPPAEPIAPPLPDLQERLNDRNRLMVSATRYMIQANPQWGYLVDDELNLVLPVEGLPPVEHLQWLLNNTLTASQVRLLLERNPNWGLFIDLDGQLCDF